MFPFVHSTKKRCRSTLHRSHMLKTVFVCALAGVVGHIPADEVIDAMAEVGAAMSNDLRETGIGGLAGTPTGKAIRDIVQMQG